MIRIAFLTALLAVAADASAVEMSDLTKCRAVTDVTARAECYDHIVDAAVKKGEKTVAQPQASFKPAPVPTEKTVAVAKATRAGNGRLIIATADGEVWTQTEGEGPKAPQAGDQLKISKGSMGGFFCSTDKYTTFRCKLRRD